MIEAYAIGISAKLEDGVSPALISIIGYAEKASASLDSVLASVRAISKAGLSLGRNLEKASVAAGALADSSSGLTRASAILDSMAVSSADVARNLKSANVESNGVGRTGGHGSGYSSSGSSSSNNVSGAIGLSALFGIVENARLQDANIKSSATSQIPINQWGNNASALRDREFAYASKYGWATGGKIAPFGESMLESSRLLRTLTQDQQTKMLDIAMPYIALESKLKNIE